MAYGLQVWDESGQLVVDYTDRLGRANSTVVVGGLATRTGITVSVPGFSTDGTWFYCTSTADYAEITAQAGGFYVYNVSYYEPTTSFTIYIFRG